MVQLNQKGIILITVYLIVVILLAFLLPMVTRSIAEYRAAQRQRNLSQALYLAEAGAEEAVRQLQLDSNYDPSPTYTALGNGGYLIMVNADLPSDDQRKITSIGYVPNNNPNSYGYQSVTLETYVRFKEKPLFPAATFSIDDTELRTSVLVDSYNSSLGAYGGENIGTEGNIVTSAVTSGAITLRDDANVYGSATVGVGGNPNTSIVLRGNASISGSQQAASVETQLPALPTPPESVSDSVSIKGRTVLTLDPGTHWYNSVSIKEEAQVVLTGPSVLNSLGDVKIGGYGIATYNNLPANLTINVVNDGSAKVEYTSSRNLYGGIYAPNNQVNLSGSGQIFGAIVADEIAATDSLQIHYDTALQDEGGGIGFNINDLSWRQQ